MELQSVYESARKEVENVTIQSTSKYILAIKKHLRINNNYSMNIFYSINITFDLIPVTVTTISNSFPKKKLQQF